MCLLRASYSNVFNVDYKSEAFGFLVSSQTRITHEMVGGVVVVGGGLEQSRPGKTHLLYPFSELAWAPEKHKGMPTSRVWGAPPKSNKKPLFGNHQ